MITLAELLSYYATGSPAEGFSAGVTFNLDNGVVVTNSTGTIRIDENGIVITDGSFSFANSTGDVTIDDNGIVITGGLFTLTTDQGKVLIDSSGFNTYFVDYFKNMVYNSSFENFDPATLTPYYWQGDGVADPNSNFYGTYSCKLTAGQYIEQTSTAHINPSFFDNETARVSFHRKLGQMKLEVYDVTNGACFTLTSEDGDTGASITFDATPNWQLSRASAQFDPTENGTCTALKIILTNVHATETGYVDAVMLAPDYSGKYPQIYKDGPKSSSSASIGLYIQPEEPDSPTVSDAWIDTDNYSRYDVLVCATSRSIAMSDEEVCIATTSGITLTLEVPTQDGVVKHIKNATAGSITIDGLIDTGTTISITTMSALTLVSYSGIWYILGV